MRRLQVKFIKYTEEAIKAAAQKAYDDTITKLSTDAVACHGKDKGSKAEVRPQIHFSDEAWAKSKALVNNCDAEIAWHGLVAREGLTFLITDVHVPPQSVTGTTVESDSNEWAVWASGFSDEEFVSLRCHMHSHVNMGVFSSTTDDDYQKDMVTKNPGLDYYLFLIFNKRGDVFARVYDVENNIMYDNDDVDVYAGRNDADEWAKDQIKVFVKKKTFRASTAHKDTIKSTRGKYSYMQYNGDDYDEDGFYYGFGR